jgi:hypothetical protein
MTNFIEVPANKNSLIKRKPVLGMGINDASYMVQPTINGNRLCCQYYRAWKNMLNRCYNKDYHKKYPTYIGCEVSSDWLIFSKFREWMETQDWEGKYLDKDILIAKNKIYGPEFCIFVSASVNNLLLDSGSIRGNLPQGVCLNRRSKKYQASCKVDGKCKYLGSYITSREASIAYLDFKQRNIIKVAKDYKSDNKLYSALISHAEALYNQSQMQCIM